MIMTKLIMLREQARDFFAREEGASAIEYSIIAGLIAVVMIVAVTDVGTQINTIFETIKTKLTAVNT